MIPLSHAHRRQIIQNSYKCSNSVKPDTPWTLFLLTLEHLFCTMKVERTKVYLQFDSILLQELICSLFDPHEACIPVLWGFPNAGS